MWTTSLLKITFLRLTVVFLLYLKYSLILLYLPLITGSSGKQTVTETEERKQEKQRNSAASFQRRRHLCCD